MAFVPAIAPPDPTSPRSRWLVFDADGLVTDGASPLDDAGAASLGVEHGLYLGAEDGDGVWVARLPSGAVLPPSFVVRSLRSILIGGDEALGALAGRAAQVLHWDETHRYCGRCGAPTERSTTERCRRCPSCALDSYPRVSPAVIVLVRRGDRALLARSARFPVPFFSTLAGFVEPGETLEETVAREIREEVGVDVAGLRYFGSQPWPFPHSLMVAFLADHAGGEITIDGVEIADAQWFAPDTLPTLPPRASIARHMIDAWLAEHGVRAP